MLKVALVILFRISLLIAITASAALYVEYQNAGDPAFCGVGTGCMAVRLSPYSRLFGVPLPVIGLFAFSALFLFAVFAHTRARRAAATALALLGGVGAVVLILLQGLVIKAFCIWCVTVDVSAILAAISAVLLYRLATRDGAEDAALLAFNGPGIRAAWGGSFVVAFALPFIWAQYPVIPPAPAPITAMAVPGKITIVTFTDFECPFCRRLHPVLHELESAHPDRIALIRKMMPLSGHRGAMPAALAWVCVPEDKREKMADSLYNAPEPLLTREGTLGIAAGLKLDGEAMKRCVEDPETEKKVAADMALFKEIEGAALPLTYVGPRAILGYNPDKLRAFVSQALEGGRPSLPVPWMFVALGAVIAAVAGSSSAMARRASSDNNAPESPSLR